MPRQQKPGYSKKTIGRAKKASDKKPKAAPEPPPRDRTYSDIRRSVRMSDGFDNFVSRLGLNNDNALSAGEYTFNFKTRNRIELEAAYRGSWIVGAVIDSIPEDMTRAGIDITTNQEDEDIDEIQNQISTLQIFKSFCFGSKMGRLYGGAIGVVQIEGQDPRTPLDVETITKDQFKGITIYDRWQLNPRLIDTVPIGPDAGLPIYYDIVTRPSSTDPTAVQIGLLTVHRSRVIRFTGIDLPYYQAITEMMWGESILERLWDRLIAFDNATMSSASLIDRANLRTISIEGLREIISNGGPAYDGLLSMFEMMRRLQVNEGITLLDKEDQYQSTAYSFAGLSDMMLQFGQQLAGASGIPLVRLFGQSPAGLSSTGESDIRMYYDNIKAQQEAKYRMGIDLVLKILWRSTFDKEAPDDLEFTFTPLWQMTELDKATIARTNTETILGAFENNVIDKPTAMKELRDSVGNNGLFANITDEMIQDAEDEPIPMPGEMQPGEVAPGQEGKPPAAVNPDDPAKKPTKSLDSVKHYRPDIFEKLMNDAIPESRRKVKTVDSKTQTWKEIELWAKK